YPVPRAALGIRIAQLETVLARPHPALARIDLRLSRRWPNDYSDNRNYVSGPAAETCFFVLRHFQDEIKQHPEPVCIEPVDEGNLVRVTGVPPLSLRVTA